uniref:Uncharacterized protein n=1 Tax=Lepeophtheirus salmonis TaxID=72036 RepID=A0A0K2U0E7_LEPSM
MNFKETNECFGRHTIFELSHFGKVLEVIAEDSLESIDEDGNLLYFVAVYITRNVSRSLNCEHCINFLIKSTSVPKVNVQIDDNNPNLKLMSKLMIIIRTMLKTEIHLSIK